MRLCFSRLYRVPIFDRDKTKGAQADGVWARYASSRARISDLGAALVEVQRLDRRGTAFVGGPLCATDHVNGVAYRRNPPTVARRRDWDERGPFGLGDVVGLHHSQHLGRFFAAN